MRQTVLLNRWLLLAAFLFFYSCKKESEQLKFTEETKIEVSVKKELAVKVVAWLEEQQLSFTGSRSETIESLKQSLVQSCISLESYRNNEQFIVVPLVANFKSLNNIDKHTINYLVAVMADGIITKGNVIQFVAANGQKPILNSTFSKVFTYQSIDCDGQFTVLSITDDFRYELKFEKGKLKSVAERKRKILDGSSGKAQETCTNWYLVTTFYNMDGSVTEYWNFLYTVCEPDCWLNKIVAGRNFTDCSGGGGEIDYEYEVTRPKMWVVYTSPDGLNTVRSNEWLTGKKRPNNDSYFTNVRHQDDGVQNTLGDAHESAATWTKYDNSWSYSLSNANKDATVTISGELTYVNKPPKQVLNKTSSWSANSVL